MKFPESIRRHFKVIRAFCTVRIWLNPTLETLEESLGTTILGVLPTTKNLLQRVGLGGNEGTQYQLLCSNLELAMKTRGHKYLGLLPSGKQNNAPAIGLNVATVYARQGRRVLLIDLNFEFSGLHLLVNANPKLGLTNYLSGYAPLGAIIQKSPMPSLEVVVPGPPRFKRCTADELGHLRRNLDQFETQYDLVLVLCPPADCRTPTTVFNPLTDALACVTANSTRDLYDVAYLADHLGQCGADLLGVILDDVLECDGSRFPAALTTAGDPNAP